MLTTEKLRKLSQVTSENYAGKIVRIPLKVWRAGSVVSHVEVELSASSAKDVARVVRKIARKLLE